MEQMISSRLPNGMPGMRVAPKMAPEAYRSFEVHQPAQTHYQSVTCKQADCADYRDGWISRFDGSTPEGKRWAAAIRASGRRFTVTTEGSVLTFRFGAGQRCFKAPHKVPTGRPEIYVVRDGDWRGNPTGRSDRGIRPAEFVERMEENLAKLHDAARRG